MMVGTLAQDILLLPALQLTSFLLHPASFLGSEMRLTSITPVYHVQRCCTSCVEEMGDRNVFAGRLFMLGRDNPRCTGEDPIVMIISKSCGPWGREWGCYWACSITSASYSCMVLWLVKGQAPFQNGVRKLSMQLSVQVLQMACWLGRSLGARVLGKMFW